MAMNRFLLPKSVRSLYVAIAAICFGLLGFGYYLQFYAGQEPCPLCIFQRLAYIAIAVIAAAGAIHAPAGLGRMGYAGSILLASLFGAVIAGRQVWLQHLPADQVPECGPGLDYMLDVFPVSETVRLVFSGSGECAEVSWTFFSLSIAEWSLIWFVLFAVLTAIQCRAVLPRFR